MAFLLHSGQMVISVDSRIRELENFYRVAWRREILQIYQNQDYKVKKFLRPTEQATKGRAEN